MSRIRARALQRREFKDPKPILVDLRAVAGFVATSSLPDNVKNLRTHDLKRWRELRAGCIFCYGMGRRIGQTVFIADEEGDDYDFIASWVVGGEQHLAPVQMKEVVPKDLNAAATVQSVVDSLTKYVDAADLTVAIHLNQAARFEPGNLVIPKLNIAALWVFAAVSDDQRRWGLWGNFMEEPQGGLFEYPT